MAKSKESTTQRMKRIRDELCGEQRWKCYYCRQQMRKIRPDMKTLPPDAATLDHLIPVSKGGTSERTNLVAACNGCNQAKKSHEWRKGVSWNGPPEGA